MDKNIAYWSKHQELDKFNYNIANSKYIAAISLMVVLFFGILTYTINTGDKYTLNVTIIIVIIVISISMIFYIKNTYASNNAFRIREAMIRIWYKKGGVDTNLLDAQFEKIKKEKKFLMSNKDIEDLARRVINTGKNKKKKWIKKN